jgi:hypothetical protein
MHRFRRGLLLRLNQPALLNRTSVPGNLLLNLTFVKQRHPEEQDLPVQNTFHLEKKNKAQALSKNARIPVPTQRMSPQEILRSMMPWMIRLTRSPYSLLTASKLTKNFQK